jgi:hypothetical protein
MESYGFTIKLVRRGYTASKEDYKETLEEWKVHDPSLIVRYEDDSRGRCHCHGVIQLPKGFYRKSLAPKGYTWKLERIYDEKGWHRYINKDQLKTKLKKSLFTKGT